MTRKQRIHSAELRRLDHIARSLDRIGDAIEKLHEVIVSGNNDRVAIIHGSIEDNAQLSQDVNQTVGRDGNNSVQGNDNTLTMGIGSPVVSGVKMNIPSGVRDINILPHNPGTGEPNTPLLLSRGESLPDSKLK